MQRHTCPTAFAQLVLWLPLTNVTIAPKEPSYRDNARIARACSTAKGALSLSLTCDKSALMPTMRQFTQIVCRCVVDFR